LEKTHIFIDGGKATVHPPPIYLLQRDLMGKYREGEGGRGN